MIKDRCLIVVEWTDGHMIDNRKLIEKAKLFIKKFVLRYITDKGKWLFSVFL